MVHIDNPMMSRLIVRHANVLQKAKRRIILSWMSRWVLNGTYCIKANGARAAQIGWCRIKAYGCGGLCVSHLFIQGKSRQMIIDAWKEKMEECIYCRID